MKVRAKFYVDRVEPTTEGGEVVLYPVVGGSAENDSFYKYTPAGSIHLSTINESAIEQFEVGGQYYVDFTPVE